MSPSLEAGTCLPSAPQAGTGVRVARSCRGTAAHALSEPRVIKQTLQTGTLGHMASRGPGSHRGEPPSSLRRHLLFPLVPTQNHPLKTENAIFS